MMLMWVLWVLWVLKMVCNHWLAQLVRNSSPPWCPVSSSVQVKRLQQDLGSESDAEPQAILIAWWQLYDWQNGPVVQQQNWTVGTGNNWFDLLDLQEKELTQKEKDELQKAKDELQKAKDDQASLSQPKTNQWTIATSCGKRFVRISAVRQWTCLRCTRSSWKMQPERP